VTGWERGRAEILGMLERGELTQVNADTELAERLIQAARQHVVSAGLLADRDPYLAYSAVHDAIRKALSALLQVQGLRPTTSGGHLAVTQAVHAQFGASMGAILRPVDRIRVTRHAAEYPGPSTYIDPDTVRQDLPKAEAVLDAVTKALPHLSVFTAGRSG
jgi:HEPN domain